MIGISLTSLDEAAINRIMQSIIELEKEDIRANNRKTFNQMVQCIKNEIRKEVESRYPPGESE